MEETKIIKFVLGKGFKFTGREISSKLVVSKNKDLEGNCVTLIMSKRKGLYFFHPIADIYLDYNKLQLIMPKHQPIFVSKGLYRDIIPSSKYKRHYVFAPDSDIQTVFKEIEFPNNKKYWCLVYDTIILQKYSWHDYSWNFNDPRSEQSGYFSTHQLNEKKIEVVKQEADYDRAIYQECQEMNDELFEEAGYDFMD